MVALVAVAGGAMGVAEAADSSPPETTITFGPLADSGSPYVAFEFESSESGSLFDCSLDGAPFRFCTSPTWYDGLPDGPHVFAVRATDSEGNTDPTPAERAWKVDTVPPNTVITSGPSGSGPATKATFTFESPESGMTFACSIDGGSFSTCSSPKSYSDLLDGTHVFRVRAVDGARNPDPTPAEATWKIDARGPQLAIDRPTTGVYINDQQVSQQGHPPITVGTLTVQARAIDGESGVATFAFSVNGALVDPSKVTFQNGRYQFAFVPPSPGEHIIGLRASNGAGLISTMSIRVVGIPA